MIHHWVRSSGAIHAFEPPPDGTGQPHGRCSGYARVLDGGAVQVVAWPGTTRRRQSDAGDLDEAEHTLRAWIGGA